MEISELAVQAAGNWMSFQSFGWRTQPEDGENWCIVYTHNRDSGLLEQSNAAAIAAELESFLEADDPDVVCEHHGHFACGWVDGYSIRVYRDGEITAAFQKWCEIQDRLSDYPILDESDYSDRESEATFANIADAAYSVSQDYDLPQDWEDEVYWWLSNHDPGAVENCDDQGGYPSEEQIVAAFEGLGYERIED